MSLNTTIEHEIRKNVRHNLIVNALDGGFFWAGCSFIATSTILPLYVSHLTDSKLAIGILSMISSMGFLAPQLFTANWVQRLPRKKVLPINWGLFLERLPVILLPFSVYLLASHSPTWALIVFLLLFTWHVGGAGLLAVAWQDMIAKIIPVEVRGRFFGITNFAGTATGVLGASAAAWMLNQYGFPNGYVLSFASAAILIFISWIFLAMVREPAQETHAEKVSQLEFMRRLPAVLRADPNFFRYLLSRMVVALGGMAGGFLTVYAVKRWGLSDGQAGGFTVAMLLGQALSNLAFGPLADRQGHKIVLEAGFGLGTLALGLAALSPQPGWFYIVFALTGAQSAGFMLSGLMIAVEFCTPDARPTYIGLNNTLVGLVGGLSPIIGGWLAEGLGYQGLFVVAFTIELIGLALLHWSVHEPRRVNA